MKQESEKYYTEIFNQASDDQLGNWLKQVFVEQYTDSKYPGKGDSRSTIEHLMDELPLEQKLRMGRTVIKILEELTIDVRGALSPSGAGELLFNLPRIIEDPEFAVYRTRIVNSLDKIIANNESKNVLNPEEGDNDVSIHWRACQALLQIHEYKNPGFWEDLVKENGVTYVRLAFAGITATDFRRGIEWLKGCLNSEEFHKEAISGLFLRMALFREVNGLEEVNWAISELEPKMHESELEDLKKLQEQLQEPISDYPKDN